jgi:N-acetylglucosaminyl-diphospho-decaprenol L-rhamnosyltransferase
MKTAHECRLSIIIVNWNTADLLRQCLDSFYREASESGIEIIVVDNASSDGSVTMVEEAFPEVVLICNPRNLGFARANNQALRVARGAYVLLLNSDTIIKQGGLWEAWLAFMDSHPYAGASGCRLIYPDGSHQVGDAGFRPDPTTTCNYALFLTHLSPSRFNGLFLSYRKLSAPLEVDWVCGAALLVRASILDQVGLLDEKHFMYAEDVEWGCRIKSQGFAVYYLPHLEIIHLQGASTRKQEDSKEFSLLWLANLRRLYSFYHGSRGLLLFDLMLSFGFLLRSVFYYLLSLKQAGENLRAKSFRMAKCLEFCLRQVGNRA